MATAPLRTVTEHHAVALALCEPLTAHRTPLADAHGLVLAAEVLAGTDTPPFDNSAMDGFAVRHVDVAHASPEAPVTLTVVGDVPAGSADDPAVPARTAVRIMTGAPVPTHATAIVPVEHTDVPSGPGALPATVTVHHAPALGGHVRRAGEDVQAGDVVLTAGTRLSARAIAAVASAGSALVAVHPRPRVGVLSTGSELVAPGTALRRGQIPDSNSYLLAAAVEEAGGIAVRVGAVTDDATAFAAALTELAGEVDMIVTTGGVSVGAFDVVREVLESSATVEFTPVAMQPGKPQGLGTWHGVPIFTLPGNPVSAFVSFEAFVRPGLRRMAGHTDVERRVVERPAGAAWRSPEGREQLMPVRFVDHGVVPATGRGSGSHLVASLAHAEGLAIVPADVTEVAEGDELRVMLLS